MKIRERLRDHAGVCQEIPCFSFDRQKWKNIYVIFCLLRNKNLNKKLFSPSTHDNDY